MPFLVLELKRRVMQPKQQNVNYIFLFQWYKNNFVKNDFQLKLKSRVHL